MSRGGGTVVSTGWAVGIERATAGGGATGAGSAAGAAGCARDGGATRRTDRNAVSTSRYIKPLREGTAV
jgi:hypothetical protein